MSYPIECCSESHVHVETLKVRGIFRSWWGGGHRDRSPLCCDMCGDDRVALVRLNSLMGRKQLCRRCAPGPFNAAAEIMKENWLNGMKLGAAAREACDES